MKTPRRPAVALAQVMLSQLMWLKETNARDVGRRSPFSRAPLTAEELVPHDELREEIAAWKANR